MRKENRHGQEECYISVDMDTGGMATSRGISGLPEAEKAEKYPSPRVWEGHSSIHSFDKDF